MPYLWLVPLSGEVPQLAGRGENAVNPVPNRLASFGEPGEGVMIVGGNIKQ